MHRFKNLSLKMQFSYISSSILHLRVQMMLVKIIKNIKINNSKSKSTLDAEMNVFDSSY